MTSPFYTAEHEAFREVMRRFVEKEIEPYAHEWDEAGEFPRALYEKAAGIGPVYVACAEPEIAAAITRAGGEAVLTRADHPSGSDRIYEALTKIDQPLVPQFLMSGAAGQESGSAGLIPTAMLSSMFGQMMPDALERLKGEAPKAGRRSNGA